MIISPREPYIDIYDDNVSLVYGQNLSIGLAYMVSRFEIRKSPSNTTISLNK